MDAKSRKTRPFAEHALRLTRDEFSGVRGCQATPGSTPLSGRLILWRKAVAAVSDPACDQVPARGLEPPRPKGHRPSTCRVYQFHHAGSLPSDYSEAVSSCQLGGSHASEAARAMRIKPKMLASIWIRSGEQRDGPTAGVRAAMGSGAASGTTTALYRCPSTVSRSRFQSAVPEGTLACSDRRRAHGRWLESSLSRSLRAAPASTPPSLTWPGCEADPRRTPGVRRYSMRAGAWER